MDAKHESEPESDLTEAEMTRLERMREHLRYCGGFDNELLDRCPTLNGEEGSPNVSGA